MFWQPHLGGWALFALATFPLKVLMWGSVGKAVVLTLVRETLGFVGTLGLREVYRRAPIGLGRPLRLAGVLVAGAMALSWVEAGCCGKLAFVAEAPALAGMQRMGTLYFRGMLYVVWGMLYFWIRGRMAERARMEAEAKAQRAELMLLRAQASPHFLFNAFNTILAGLEGDPKALQPVVQGLADYLRYSLRHKEMAEVLLSEEFEAALNYLTVEKARFGEDVEMGSHLGEGAMGARVPAVFLQPLEENAVKHGMKTSPMPLRVTMRADVLPDGRVWLEVANTGAWIEPGAGAGGREGGGQGLSILRRRLGLLYGDRHEFSVASAGGEVRVRVVIPASPMEGGVG